MNKNSKIYVAGHTGLVGSAITTVLEEKGYSHLILRTLEELDLTDQKAVDDFFTREKPDYVFLAAAKVGGILANNTLRADFIYTNLLIQSNIIHCSWKHGVRKLLFLGSTCIYPGNAAQPLTEDSLLTSQLEYTNEPYAIAKIAGIKMCESFNIQYKTNFISVMPTNLYGLRDNYDLEKSHVLPALLRKFHLGRCLETNNWNALRKDLNRYPVGSLNGDSDEKSVLTVLDFHGITLIDEKSQRKVSVKIWGTGTPLREFMYSKDLAEACVYLMEKTDIPDIVKLHKSRHPDQADYNPPHFLNIGTGEEISIKRLAEKIKTLTGFTGDIMFDPLKPDGTLRKVTETSILHDLGFHHKVSLDEGLWKTYEEYLKYK
ncbi:MAG: GDP-L-fucose synthase [Bacteroidota bacterium]